MKKIVQMIVAVALLVGNINAKESKAKKLCDDEMKKEQPQKSVVENQCLKIAKEYEVAKKYATASWYYLLAGDNYYNISDIEKKIPSGHNIGNVAHSYVVLNKLDKAKILYATFLKTASIPWADEAMKDDYKQLHKLYPKQKEDLDKGLAFWNKLYKPLLKVNTLYPQYEKAKKDKQYKEAIEYLFKVIAVQRESGLQNGLAIANNEINLGIVYNYNKEYTESLEVLHKVEKIYENEKSREDSLVSLYGWIADSYENIKEYNNAIVYYKKKINLKKKINTTKDNPLLIVNDMYSLGVSYNHAKQYKKSIEIFNEVKPFYKNNPKKQLSYAYLLAWIADANENLKNYLKAIKYRKQALEVYVKADSVENMETTYSKISALYIKIANSEKAVYWKKKQLDVSKNKGNASFSLASIYAQNKNLKSAKDMYMKSIEHYIKDKNDKGLSISYFRLGEILDALEQYTEAEKAFLGSLDVDKRILGEGHEELLVTYEQLANVIMAQAREYYDKGQYPAAEKIYKKSYSFYKKAKKDNTVLFAVCSSFLGKSIIESKRYKEAEGYLKEASKLVDLEGLPYGYKQFIIQQYVIALAQQEKYGIAAPQYKKLLNLARVKYGAESNEVIDFNETYTLLQSKLVGNKNDEVTTTSEKIIQSSIPVMIGGEADYDPCSYGRISYSTPKGDPLGSVELKSGPGKEYKTTKIIKDGTYVYECDFNDGWVGIIYGKNGCGVNSPIAKNQPYKGMCESGWIPKDRYELLAG